MMSLGGRVIASAHLTPRGLRPWHIRTLLAREPGDLRLDRVICRARHSAFGSLVTTVHTISRRKSLKITKT
jgi:hypothetical protein